ncbi:MAG: autotransporter-associated beta strand repeat-containing protein [Thermoguttaceae bacterium]|nr:autotransporter-associated beta strand repeat-containing protein [Thermoguttaceae bacterium]
MKRLGYFFTGLGIALFLLTTAAVADTIDIPSGTTRIYDDIKGNTITGSGTIQVTNNSDVTNTSTNLSGFTGVVSLCGDARFLVKSQTYLGNANVSYDVSGNNQLYLQSSSSSGGLNVTIKSLTLNSQGKSGWGGAVRLTGTILNVTDGINVTGSSRISSIMDYNDAVLNSNITIADNCTLGFDAGWAGKVLTVNGNVTGAGAAVTFGENYMLNHANAAYFVGKATDKTSSAAYNVNSISALAGSKVYFNTGTVTANSISAENTATLVFSESALTVGSISGAGSMTQMGGTFTPGGVGAAGSSVIQSGVFVFDRGYEGSNLALNKTATSNNGVYSSSFTPSKAVDGNVSTFFISKDASLLDHSLTVDLGQEYTLGLIHYIDREVGNILPMSRSGNYFQFFLYDSNGNETYASEQFTVYTKGGINYYLAQDAQGREPTGQVLKIVEHIPRPNGTIESYLEIAELEAYQLKNAQVVLDLGSGTEFDKIVVNSGAELRLNNNVDLAVNLLDSFNPRTTDTFQVLDVQGTLTGTFDSLVLPETWNSRTLNWNTDNLYSTGTISVSMDPVYYPVADNDATAIVVDGIAYDGVEFDSDTAPGVTSADHSGGVTLSDDAEFVVGSGYSLTQSSPISGTGSLTKSGAGTLILSAANTYDGGTTVSEGVLKLTGDAVTVNGMVTLEENGVLEINVAKNDEKTLAFTDSTILGNGDILKTGEGRLKINTDELDQATEDLHFTANNFVVASGRVDLEGYMLGNIEVDANSVFSPGNSIGEATFGGGYILKDGATLLLEVGKDGDSYPTDVLKVTGETTFENDSIIKIALDSSYDNEFEDEDVVDIQLPLGIKGSDGDLDMSKLVFQSSMFELIGYDSGTGVLSVRYAPSVGVPEPSTWALLLLGVVVLFLRKRK